MFVPLIIAGAIVGGLIAHLTDKKAGDKGANVITPKEPLNEPATDQGNGGAGNGGSSSGVDPENDHSTSNEGLADNGTPEQPVGT